MNDREMMDQNYFRRQLVIGLLIIAAFISFQIWLQLQRCYLLSYRVNSECRALEERLCEWQELNKDERMKYASFTLWLQEKLKK